MSRLRYMLPSTQSLFVFEAAARNLNFKQAAAELNVTQPSVSHTIKALERHCKVDLFVRDNRGVQLTDRGKLLYDSVRSGFERIEQSLKAISPDATQYIAVAASTSMAAHWFVPNLPIFQQHNPGIKIKIVTTNRDVEPDPHVDITIWIRSRDFQRPNSWYICDEVIFPVCAPSYVKNTTIQNVGDLIEHQLLHYFDPHRKRMQWNEWLSLAGLETAAVVPDLVFNDYQLAVQAALSGEGIALGWSLTLQPLLQRKLLIKPLDAEIRTNNAFFIVANERNAKLSQIEPLVEWILATTQNF